MNLLSQSPEHWNYRHAPPDPAVISLKIPQIPKGNAFQTFI
jgi:hypothetical protein